MLSTVCRVSAAQEEVRSGRALSERMVSALPENVCGTTMISSPRTALWLWLLLALFCLRVGGQMLVAFAGVTWLPPMEEWFSGLIPYPWLLASQFVIIALFAWIALDMSRGRGYF